MEARELRIGNIIEHGDDGIASVSGYGIYQMSTTENGGIQYCKDWKPIPLTEEWLLKFGFDKKPTQKIRSWYKKNNIMVSVNVDSLVYYKDVGIENNIKHVHQLQNLYFALTGEELTIK